MCQPVTLVQSPSLSEERRPRTWTCLHRIPHVSRLHAKTHNEEHEHTGKCLPAPQDSRQDNFAKRGRGSPRIFFLQQWAQGQWRSQRERETSGSYDGTYFQGPPLYWIPILPYTPSLPGRSHHSFPPVFPPGPGWPGFCMAPAQGPRTSSEDHRVPLSRATASFEPDSNIARGPSIALRSPFVARSSARRFALWSNR